MNEKKLNNFAYTDVISEQFSLVLNNIVFFFFYQNLIIILFYTSESYSEFKMILK